MKPKRILCLVAVLFGALSCGSLAFCGMTAPGSDDSKALKFKLLEPWNKATIVLVHPGTPKNPGETLNVETYQAVYEFVPKRQLSQGMQVFSMLVVRDPFTKSKIFIDGEHSFYVSEGGGLMGITVAPQSLVWSRSYLTVPDSEERTAAISQFEQTFDATEIDKSWAKRGTINGMMYAYALPRFYSSDAPAPGGLSVMPEVEVVDITDGILHLDIRNSTTKVPASLWINLDQKKLIKAIADGKEMDLRPHGINPGFTVPMEGK